MNATTALKQASEHGGPVVFGAGMMLLSLAVVTSGHGVQPAAAGPSPSPAVTSPASPPTGVRRSPHPAPSSPADGALLAVGEPAHRSGGGSGGVSGSGSEPAPAPSPEPPASSGRGGVSVRLPLGVLPRVGVHLTIGGRK